MSDHVYKSIEITGTSEVSIQDAIEIGIAKANNSIKNMRWFEVLQTRGSIDEGKVGRWQVTIKIGFTLNDEDWKHVKI